MLVACEVLFSKEAEKNLRKVPPYIAIKLQQWVELVENEGIREARKIKSFHDEPLMGKRNGERSIRLNKAYRAIYKEIKFLKILRLEVIEVNKHEY